MATTTRGRLTRALRPVRNGRSDARAPIEGPFRLGRKTKDLVKHIHAGEIAVIDHLNLDRIAAEELAASGACAVINCAESSDGTYPNAGPLTLVRAGVPLIDLAGADLFERLSDGDVVAIDGGVVRIDGKRLSGVSLL